MPIPPGNSTLSESLKILAETGTRKKIWPDSTFTGTEALDRESIHLAKSLLQDLLETLEFDDSKKALQAYRGVSLDSTNELQQKIWPKSWSVPRRNSRLSSLSPIAYPRPCSLTRQSTFQSLRMSAKRLHPTLTNPHHLLTAGF